MLWSKVPTQCRLSSYTQFLWLSSMNFLLFKAFVEVKKTWIFARMEEIGWIIWKLFLRSDEHKKVHLRSQLLSLRLHDLFIIDFIPDGILNVICNRLLNVLKCVIVIKNSISSIFWLTLQPKREGASQGLWQGHILKYSGGADDPKFHYKDISPLHVDVHQDKICDPLL